MKMGDRYLIISIILIVLISGCIQQDQDIEQKTKIKECNIDFDCIIGGCSGQVCSPKSDGPIVTTCEWKEEYACYKLTTCSCINGKCQWKETEEFNRCLKKYI